MHLEIKVTEYKHASGSLLLDENGFCWLKITVLGNPGWCWQLTASNSVGPRRIVATGTYQEGDNVVGISIDDVNEMDAYLGVVERYRNVGGE